MTRNTIKRTIQFFQIRAVDHYNNDIPLESIIKKIISKSKVFSSDRLEDTIYWQALRNPARYIYMITNDSDAFPIRGKVVLARRDELPQSVKRDSNLEPIRLDPDSIGIGETTHFVLFKERIGNKDIYVIGYEYNQYGARINKFVQYLREKAKDAPDLSVKNIKHYMLLNKEFAYKLLKHRNVKRLLLSLHIPKWLLASYKIEEATEERSPLKGLFKLINTVTELFDEDNTYTINLIVSSKRRHFLRKDGVDTFIGEIVDIISDQFEGEKEASPFRTLRVTLEMGQEIDILNPMLKVKILDIPLLDPARKIIDSEKFYEAIQSSYNEIVKPDIDKIRWVL